MALHTRVIIWNFVLSHHFFREVGDVISSCNGVFSVEEIVTESQRCMSGI